MSVLVPLPAPLHAPELRRRGMQAPPGVQIHHHRAGGGSSSSSSPLAPLNRPSTSTSCSSASGSGVHQRGAAGVLHGARAPRLCGRHAQEGCGAAGLVPLRGRDLAQAGRPLARSDLPRWPGASLRGSGCRV